MFKRHRQRGFTLVEILIVVVIIGILAIIIVPKCAQFTDQTRATTTVALLRTIRNQIEFYQAQHQGTNPTLAQMWANLTSPTKLDGTPDGSGRFGPCLRQVPINQYTLSDTIVATGTGTANDGWEYDEAAGKIAAVGFDEATETFTPP